MGLARLIMYEHYKATHEEFEAYNQCQADEDLETDQLSPISLENEKRAWIFLAASCADKI